MLSRITWRRVQTSEICRCRNSRLSVLPGCTASLQRLISWFVLRRFHGRRRKVKGAPDSRLFFHRPRFAILDESTSAMPQPLERRFLRLARELGHWAARCFCAMSWTSFKLGVSNASLNAPCCGTASPAKAFPGYCCSESICCLVMLEAFREHRSILYHVQTEAADRFRRVLHHHSPTPNSELER